MLSGILQTTLSPSTPQWAFKLEQSTSATFGGGGGEFELADPNDAKHVGVPLTGKVVEMHHALVVLQKAPRDTNSNSAPKDRERLRVRKGEALVVLSVMKMENLAVAPFDVFVERVGKGVKVGTVVGEGTLACVLEEDGSGRQWVASSKL
jgi:biotin carboxyl carrier protein